jgi:protein SCO1/2
MHRMQIIQRRVKGVGQAIALVSLTVDPETDVPAVLFKKARELGANPYVWKFLTGSPDVVKTLIVEGFKSAVGDKTSGSPYDIVHSGKFFLVDGDGNVRSMYSNTDQEIDQMMIDIGLLINRHKKG